MKRLALLIITAASFATANAQFAFGVKAGGNFSTFTGDVNGAQTLIGLNAGAYVKLPIARFVSLQPELMYSGQGTTYSTSDGTETQRLNYVNVPILLKFAHRSGLYLETGPQIGFLLSAQDKLNGNSADMKSELRSADFSWAFGFGYKVAHSPVGIDFRYNAGISNILAPQEVNPNFPSSVHNDVFQLGLTYVLFSM